MIDVFKLTIAKEKKKERASQSLDSTASGPGQSREIWPSEPQV